VVPGMNVTDTRPLMEYVGRAWRVGRTDE
jgi:hypothetical protein